MPAAHVACHPGLLCHASWSVRLPALRVAASFVKNPLSFSSQRTQEPAFIAGFVLQWLYQICEVPAPGAKLNLLYCFIASCKNSFAIFFLSSLNVKTGADCTAATNANGRACAWMEFTQRVIYSTRRGRQGGERERQYRYRKEALMKMVWCFDVLHLCMLIAPPS